MSRMNKILAVLLLSGAALAATSSPVQGQGATSALQGHNTNAPIDVAADQLEVQDRADRAIWSGNVVIRQAELTLNAARVTMAYTNSDGIQLERLDASGGVTVRSPTETARGQFAVYDTRERLITVIGGVTLTRGDSNLNGGRLVIDLDTGRAVLDGSAGGPTGTSAGGGRVTGTFAVPQRSN